MIGFAMSKSIDVSRLSQIETLWSIVGIAHGAASQDAVRSAQEELLNRYAPVVHRYLQGAVRDADVASDLLQEFALRFLRGDLRGAEKKRGRYRDFLKGVLFHLIADHHRRCRRNPLPLPERFDPCDDAKLEFGDDIRFVEDWRHLLLSRTWNQLADFEKQNGQPWHALLQFRASHGELRSAELAEHFSRDLGKTVSADWVRQNLHRAREKFAAILVDEVLQTLDQPTLEQLELELIDLGVIEYCRPVLNRMP